MSGLAVEKPAKDVFQDDKPEAGQHEYWCRAIGQADFTALGRMLGSGM